MRFDVSAADAITRIELDLDGDGEPAIPVLFGVGLGFDGRYVRALAFKPVRNGTWPLTVRAFTAAGAKGSATCTPGVTVIE